MGISTIFDIGASGIAAQRQAIEVAGENIANVNTEGYARQQVIMVNNPVTTVNGFSLGTGVQVQAVQRSYDGMLQQQIVNSNSSYQESLAKQSALEQIQPSFNELNSNGLGAAVTNFFGAWQDLAANPSGTAERQSLLSKSQTLVDNFKQMNATLTSVAKSADSNLIGMTADVSGNAKNLALVNSQILSTNALGGNANELLNQRDLLMQKIAKNVGVTTSLASDGTATVTLASGDTLVSGTQYATLYTNANAGTPPTNDILVTALGNPPAATNPAGDTNITTTVGGANNSLGAIGGTLQVRDSIVPGYLSKLDELASTLVTAVNTQQSAGYGTDGTTGNNFFDPAGTTSATISLDSSLTAAKIGAALPTASDPTPSAGNNTNAISVAGILNQSFTFSTGTANVSDFYTAFVSKVGTDTQNAQNTSAQGAAFSKQLSTLREANAGVSLDEELTNLTKYQQAFQGSAKVITTATEMLDTILSLIN